ncbi:Lipase maturation factor 1|uniref:lipase maturation factor family protein n=1 Tax=Neochlamydia sp. AcF84 TaxID=2315858 RepID=UPI0014096250|nr:lipase maturation factor family protein [Neochlamydia sp. AcF84]NGY95652.1 Lipase maturation factor 1 [Neochlamydia sp. AcF84]
MQNFIESNATFIAGQWVFIKLLGLCYFLAFWSLFIQVKGLYGAKGILPMQEIFNGIRRSKTYTHYLRTPSIFWINTEDKMLKGVALVGIIGASLVLCGVAVSWMLFILCLLYLSYVSPSLYFLSFQWDVLLLEVGFAGFLLSLQSPPLPIAVFLLWIILFRIMFSSGIAKFLLGSQEWRNLSAMQYHYETQPLPNKIAYFFHHQPKWFAQLSTLAVFLFEIILPFFIFTHPDLRAYTFLILMLFQSILTLTGNFTFFNGLTIALSFVLLEDNYLPWLQPFLPLSNSPRELSTSLLVSILAISLIVLNFFQLVQLFRSLPSVERVFAIISPFYLVNKYGLFSRLATQRYEIEVEGSEDGRIWKTYEFKWKPGDLKIPPRQAAPYQPRLDWQLWFAAHGEVKHNPWFTRFIYRLMENSPEVVKLMKNNPFPDKPPTYMRANLYEYHFTTSQEKKESGNWWKRKYVGIYLPPVSKS